MRTIALQLARANDVTVQDIADLAGVGTIHVYRVLHGYCPPTKIISAVEELTGCAQQDLWPEYPWLISSNWHNFISHANGLSISGVQ